MSDFILIIPAGWVQLDWEYISNNLTGFNAESVQYWAGVDMNLVTQPLRDAGLIPVDKTVMELKIMDNTYFLVNLG
jgi:hypothetical protein